MRIASLALAFLLAVPLHARPHPLHWLKHHKLLVVSLAAAALADVADSESTAAALARCRSCAETNPLLGPHPSRLRMYSTAAALDAAFAAAGAIIAWKEDVRPAAGAAIFLAPLDAWHLVGFAHNQRVRQP